jgi:hypothetical protein
MQGPCQQQQQLQPLMQSNSCRWRRRCDGNCHCGALQCWQPLILPTRQQQCAGGVCNASWHMQ